VGSLAVYGEEDVTSPLVEFLGVVTPTAAYQHAIGWFISRQSLGCRPHAVLPHWLDVLPPATGWLVVPLAIGYGRFRGSDL
jgi:hypothetical protein